MLSYGQGCDTVQSVALQGALNARFHTKECVLETNNKIQLTMKELFFLDKDVSNGILRDDFLKI